MEINTQSMEALLHLQEQQAQLPNKNSSGSFEKILSHQLTDGHKTVSTDSALNGVSYINPLLLNDIENTQAIDADAQVLQAAFAQASGTLDLWDNYSALLENSHNANLRDAWNMLEGIDQQISQLRANPLSGRNNAFDDLVNELEILSATEKFKFNRGDYLL